MKQDTTPTHSSSRAPGSTQSGDVIQVIHEQISIEKERVVTGKVNIRKTVTEEVQSVDVPMVNEEYVINRVAVPSKILDAPPPAIRTEGDETIIPVVREITVVQKKYEVTEEIRITRVKREVPLTHEVTLRKEQVAITRSSVNDDSYRP